MTAAKILSFGAAGPIGGLVPRELAGRGAHARAFVRHNDQVRAARERGAAEVAIGDMADADSVAEALEGMDAVFYIAPVDLPDQASIGRRIVCQAVEAGVSRFVFSSVIHPVLDLPNHQGKAPVEDALVSSGLDYAILHPAILYQNLAAAWDGMKDEHVLAEPWSNDMRHSRVDYRDVAEVAAIALLEDRLVDGTFELCAPGRMNRHDIVELAAEVLGHEVEARRIDPDDLGPEMAALKPMAKHYDQHELRGNPLTLRTILEREPRTLRAYLEELAAGK